MTWLLALTALLGCTASLGSDGTGGCDDCDARNADGRPESDSGADTIPEHARYVSPEGDDSASGAADAPWKTLAVALSRLAPGDTLMVRGGVYRERAIAVQVAGTPESPIEIRGYPGEQPVVDAGLDPFRTAGNTDWELFDVEHDVYRSVATYPNVDQVYGYLGGNGASWALVPYEYELRGLRPFLTDKQDYDDAGDYYIGPGVMWSPADERLYVRLVPSKYAVSMGLPVPVSSDPRQVPMVLFVDEVALRFASTAADISLSGVDFSHAATAISFEPGATRITVRDSAIRGGRYHIRIKDDVEQVALERVTIDGGVPPWIARSDVKRPRDARPGHRFQGAGVHIANASSVTIADSRFRYLFDGIDASPAPSQLKIIDNEFFVIRDDVLEIGSASYDVEVAHNVMTSVAYGVSWNGAGQPPDGKAGTKYIHHNIIDASTPMLYGRSDPDGTLEDKFDGPLGDGMATGRAIGMHSRSSITGADPWKIYNNTFIVGADVDNRGVEAAYYIEPYDPNVPHEVYNNIFVQRSGDPIVREARLSDGSQVFDGNLYDRRPHQNARPLLEDLLDNGNGHDFASLNDFVGSAPWRATRAYYGPGWEQSGVEGDPQLDANHRPAAQGPAAQGAIPLASRGWPGASDQSFRGARAPAP